MLTFARVLTFDDADLFELVAGDFFYRYHDGLYFFRIRHQYAEFYVVSFGFELPSNKRVLQL